jgi:hypothetical protein
MPTLKKADRKVKDKRPVKLVALEVAEGKQHHKPGAIFYATEETAENLIKKKHAKKAGANSKAKED